MVYRSDSPDLRIGIILYLKGDYMKEKEIAEWMEEFMDVYADGGEWDDFESLLNKLFDRIRDLRDNVSTVMLLDDLTSDRSIDA